DGERGGIAADAPEAELREGQEPGEAIDEIECRGCDGEDQRREGHADDVVGRGEQGQCGERQRNEQSEGELQQAAISAHACPRAGGYRSSARRRGFARWHAWRGRTG